MGAITLKNFHIITHSYIAWISKEPRFYETKKNFYFNN